MSDGILGNMKDAWGVEDDGPDTGKVSGILQLAESWLEDESNSPTEIVHHFETMKNNVVGAHMQRSQALKSGDTKFDPSFVALVEKNLEDMESVEHALDMYIEAANAGERENCWDALGELEGAFESVKESGAAIDDFLKNSPLICMSCNSIGPEAICTKCGGERLTLDPNPPGDDERKIPVTDEVLDVFNAYQDVLLGKGPLSALVTNLQSLEFTYLEAEALGQQTLENEAANARIKQSATEMLEAIAQTLSGIEMMHGVTKTRKAAELNHGWRTILEKSTKASELIKRLELETGRL